MTQSIPTTTPTALPVAAEEVDNSNGHSTTTNTSRFTPTATGWYRVCGGLCCDGTTGSRTVTIDENGAEVCGCSIRLPVPGSGLDPRIATEPKLIHLNGTTDDVGTMRTPRWPARRSSPRPWPSSVGISLAMVA